MDLKQIFALKGSFDFSEAQADPQYAEMFTAIVEFMAHAEESSVREVKDLYVSPTVFRCAEYDVALFGKKLSDVSAVFRPVSHESALHELRRLSARESIQPNLIVCREEIVRVVFSALGVQYRLDIARVETQANEKSLQPKDRSRAAKSS